MSIDLAFNEKNKALNSVKNILANNSMLVVLIVLIIFGAIISDGIFLRPTNLLTILFQTSIVGVIALGQMLVIISGGIDLSVASVAILVAIIMGGTSSIRQQALSFSGLLPYVGLIPAILLGLGAGAFIGLLNGLIIVILGIPPFITTLATFLLASGIAMILTGGAPIYYPARFFVDFGAYRLFGIPGPVLLWLFLIIVIGFLLHRTRFGVKVYAIGGNERAAIYSGINSKAVKIVLYTLCGLLAGIGGFLFLSRIGSVTLDSGRNFLMQSIAIVVVGGIALTGGRGSIKDAIVGALILASLGNIMNIMLVSQYIQSAIEGLIILLAVMANVRINKASSNL